MQLKNIVPIMNTKSFSKLAPKINSLVVVNTQKKEENTDRIKKVFFEVLLRNERFKRSSLAFLASWPNWRQPWCQLLRGR